MGCLASMRLELQEDLQKTIDAGDELEYLSAAPCINQMVDPLSLQPPHSPCTSPGSATLES